MLFDTHAHYDAPEFDQDRDALLASLAAQDVSLVVNPGCDPGSSRAALALAGQYPFLYAAVGWHPENCGPYTPESLEELRRLAREEAATDRFRLLSRRERWKHYLAFWCYPLYLPMHRFSTWQWQRREREQARRREERGWNG